MLRSLVLGFGVAMLAPATVRADEPAPPPPSETRRDLGHASAALQLPEALTARQSLASRLVRITTQIANPRGAQIGAFSQCPDVEHDFPLGGDCYAGEDAAIVETRITWAPGTASFWCRFRQPDDNAYPVVVSVLCLRNAR